MEIEPLIRRYRGPLIGLIASWGVPWGEAVELAQDCFAEAFLARQRFRMDDRDPEALAGRWLRGIARNLFRDWSRRSKKRGQPLPNTELPAPADGETSTRNEQVRRAIDRLPEKQRRVVLMVYLEEASLKDAGTLLGISTRAVEGRLYQARRNLRRLLNDLDQGGVA